MGTIVITSQIGEDFREDLEQVMFFNPKQSNAEADIKNCIERYGVPEITNERGYLRIGFGSNSIVRTIAQTLYCLDRTSKGDVLAGAIVFMRSSIEDISILYVAVARPYIMKGSILTARLVWDMLRQVIDSASVIKDVRNVKLAYASAGKGRAAVKSLPVDRNRQEYKPAKRKRKPVLCPDDAITCFEFQHCEECPDNKASKQYQPLLQLNKSY